MANVTLNTLWLNDAADLSDSMSFPTMSALVGTKSNRAEVRVGANGRTRVITRAGTPRTSKARLPLLSREQVAWLDDHAGSVVLVRDGQGRKFYGIYFSPSFDELGEPTGLANTELTLTEVTHSEAV